MKNVRKTTLGKMLTAITTVLFSTSSTAMDDQKSNTNFNPVIITQIAEKAKQNSNWKIASATGKNGQVVFMTVSPATNPKNEIGMETHPFDQIIFVVEGEAKSVLNGKTSLVHSGDLIFIPEGTQHNFINENSDRPFKIISVYTGNDMPANSTYKTKSDEAD
jgi:quercetin dioxygenase-like cupin family protein